MGAEKKRLIPLAIDNQIFDNFEVDMDVRVELERADKTTMEELALLVESWGYLGIYAPLPELADYDSYEDALRFSSIKDFFLLERDAASVRYRVGWGGAPDIWLDVLFNSLDCFHLYKGRLREVALVMPK